MTDYCCHFLTPENTRNTRIPKVSWCFQGAIKWEHWLEMGQLSSSSSYPLPLVSSTQSQDINTCHSTGLLSIPWKHQACFQGVQKESSGMEWVHPYQNFLIEWHEIKQDEPSRGRRGTILICAVNDRCTPSKKKKKKFS